MASTLHRDLSGHVVNREQVIGVSRRIDGRGKFTREGDCVSTVQACRAAGRCRRQSPSTAFPTLDPAVAVSFTAPAPADCQRSTSSVVRERRLTVRRRPPLHCKGRLAALALSRPVPKTVTVGKPLLAGSSLHRPCAGVYPVEAVAPDMSSHAAWSIDFDHCHVSLTGVSIRVRYARTHRRSGLRLQVVQSSPIRLRPRSSLSPPRPTIRQTRLTVTLYVLSPPTSAATLVVRRTS